MNLTTLTLTEAHEVVRTWIMRNGNYLRVSFQEEVALREALADWANNKVRSAERAESFLDYIRERWPAFYYDMVK